MTQGTFVKTVLSSGLTLVTEAMPRRSSVAVGVWVRSGSRDEPAEWLGISHFLEHMMFKGTERRDARAIAQSLESLGGHLDAYTAREQVCYHARALAENLAEVVDVLSDIVCRSLLAPTEIDREKAVVREEILAYEDNPEEKVNDILSEQVWGGHALGRPILGTAETVTELTPDQLRDYFRRRYRPSDLVLVGTGGLEHERLVELAESHFAPPAGEPLPLSGPPPSFRPSVCHRQRDLQQLYVSLGTRGVPDVHADRYPLVVLNTLLGGGMSSRLFQSVREELGLAYSVYSAQDFYRDAGMISIGMGVSPERGREALARTRQELESLRSDGPAEEEVRQARSQIRGSVMIEQDSVNSCMMYLAHEQIYRGTHTPAEEQVRKIMAVTRDEVIDVARRYLDPARFALTALGPAPGGPITEKDWPVEV
ncbi:MAG TPA: pitrilysin family protein [Candidatus Eisenbacteria bacterium]|jgi:predicted Zn-dependent peptidase